MIVRQTGERRERDLEIAMKPSATLRLLIAIPEPYFSQFVGDSAVEEFSQHFRKVRRLDLDGMSAERWAAVLEEFAPDALMSGWGTPPVPESAVPPLRMVGHTAGGIRNLVSRSMIVRGLWVTNWGGLAAASVAEHALTLTLATLRRLSQWTRALQVDHGWRGPEINGGISLFGRRVGIHGFGAVARQLVKLLEPFECDVAAYSHGLPRQVMADFGVEACGSLEELFERSEVLIEAESLTAGSSRSVTADVLGRLPEGAAFINVGRGGVVVQEALIEAIRSGRLHAGLDVYDFEPLPADSPLRSLENVILTPHVGGPTIDHRRRCGQRAIDSLKQYAAGEVPHGIITPEIYDRST